MKQIQIPYYLVGLCLVRLFLAKQFESGKQVKGKKSKK